MPHVFGRPGNTNTSRSHYSNVWHAKSTRRRLYVVFSTDQLNKIQRVKSDDERIPWINNQNWTTIASTRSGQIIHAPQRLIEEIEGTGAEAICYAPLTELDRREEFEYEIGTVGAQVGG